MSTARRLSIYHRPGCHLCDEMLEAVERLCRGHGVIVDMVDVDTDPALKAQYGYDIPVLAADGLEICRHRLNSDQLREWLLRVEN
ncbi:MAG: glutaredoxin family protein [Gammaproteobacteria bacterium]|nr:glutaredoxin family protein [Gammaproteobacteria bacterium]MDH3768771.1 glutaredoxin family protein [Gammaproteobacteria bacterium]